MTVKKRDRAGRQVFLFSLGLSLFLLLTALGIVTVDYQGRRLSFGDNTPPFHVTDKPGGGTELEIRVLGTKTELDITKFDEMWKFLCDFSCIPHK